MFRFYRHNHTAIATDMLFHTDKRLNHCATLYLVVITPHDIFFAANVGMCE